MYYVTWLDAWKYIIIVLHIFCRTEASLVVISDDEHDVGSGMTFIKIVAGSWSLEASPKRRVNCLH